MPFNSKTYFSVFLLLLISIACQNKGFKQVEINTYSAYNISDSLQNSANIDRFINPYAEALKSQMNESIAYSENEMSVGFPEGLLGNFVCDLMLKEGRSALHTTIDFSLSNNGGLRVPLPQDSIRLRNIYELMPFDNTLVLLEMDSTIMQNLFDYIVTNKNVSVGGIQILYKNNKPETVLIQNQPYEPGKHYFMLTTNYLAQGGDHMSFLQHAKVSVESNLLLRDVIISYCRKQTTLGKNLKSKFDGRIQIN